MRKKFFRSVLLILGTSVLYLIVLINPKPLFAHSFDYKNFSVHSDEEIPDAIKYVLDDVLCRLKKSELYGETAAFNVYICNDNWRFKFFTRNGNAGGVVNFPISPNIFIRKSDIEKNAIIPPGGWMYAMDERPLSYFIAHEATHSLQRKISPILPIQAPIHIVEGYADYIGKSPDFDYQRYKDLYEKNDFKMNPKSGLYYRYHLYTAHLMDIEKMTFEEVLQEQPDLEQTLAKVLLQH